MAQSFELAYKTNLNGQSGGPPPEPRPLPQSQQSYGQLVGFPQSTLPPPLSNGLPFQPLPLPPGQLHGQLVPYAPNPDLNQVRRRQVRATQACNHCRSRKQKCDEARPCQFCRENNFDCQYKDVPPPKYVTRSHQSVVY